MSQIKDKLRLSCAFTTLPIGLEDKLAGLVDIVNMRAVYFEGKSCFFSLLRSPSHPLPRRNRQQHSLRRHPR
jgi:peptide subunit release factor RF-3